MELLGSHVKLHGAHAASAGRARGACWGRRRARASPSCCLGRPWRRRGTSADPGAWPSRPCGQRGIATCTQHMGWGRRRRAGAWPAARDCAGAERLSAMDVDMGARTHTYNWRVHAHPICKQICSESMPLAFIWAGACTSRCHAPIMAFGDSSGGKGVVVRTATGDGVVQPGGHTLNAPYHHMSCAPRSAECRQSRITAQLLWRHPTATAAPSQWRAQRAKRSPLRGPPLLAQPVALVAGNNFVVEKHEL